MVITYRMADATGAALTGLTPTITVNGSPSAGVKAEVGSGYYTYTPSAGEQSASMVIRATAPLAVAVEVVTSNTLATILGRPAPDNAGIAAVRAKTDNLPAVPASKADADAAKASADLANRVAPDNAGITTLTGRLTELRAAKLDRDLPTKADVTSAAQGVTDALPPAPDNAGIAETLAQATAAKASADLANRVEPDNAGIALTRKVVSNRTVQSLDGSTVTVYDDDDVTPLGTFVWTPTTKTTSRLS